MKKIDSKQRLFEVMGRLDKTFKPKLNENINNLPNEYFPITTPIGSSDDKLFIAIVNKGIDSHLEGFIRSNFSTKNGRRIFNFAKSELPIVLRRLEEIGTEDALSWKYDIENHNSNIGNDDVLDEVDDDEGSCLMMVEPL